MRHRLSRNRRTVVVAGMATAALAAGASYAAIPGADGTIRGCYDASGSLKVIDEAQASCPQGTTAVTWNQKGPKGDTGMRGPTGPMGPRGIAGDANVHWAHTRADGTAIDKSGSNIVYAGKWGVGRYYLQIEGIDAFKCAVTATPVRSYTDYPVMVDAYFTYDPRLVLISVKRIKESAWPLQWENVDSELNVVVNCGKKL